MKVELYFFLVAYPVVAALAIIAWLYAVWLWLRSKARFAKFMLIVAAVFTIMFVYYREILVWLGWLSP